MAVNRFFTCCGAVAMKRTVDVIGAIGGLLAFADQGLALDLRLIALSFAIAALGKRRARRLLIRRSVRINATDASATTAPARRT
jgi:hypothetical protein